MTDIRLHGIEIADVLEPLYLELQAHHARVVPELGGLAAREGTEAWAARRARYRLWFEAPTTFVVADAAKSGYALCLVVDGYDGWGAGEPIGELKDLVVAAGARPRAWQRAAGGHRGALPGARPDELPAQQICGATRPRRQPAMPTPDVAALADGPNSIAERAT